MAHSSILGADRSPVFPPGRDIDALGPSDTSDTGSDIRGRLDMDEADQKFDNLRGAPLPSDDRLRREMLEDDTDGTGTGDRASAIMSEDLRDAGDIAPDRIIGSPDELGLDVSFDADEEADEAAEDVPSPDETTRSPTTSRALDCAEWMDAGEE